MAPMKKSAQAAEKDRHLESVGAMIFHNGHLFTGADDGKIKMWTPDLKTVVAEVQAHPVNVYCLAADGDTVYSCSNDGSIKSWSIKDKLAPGPVLQKECDDEVMRLRFCNGKLYAGDVQGMVKVFQDGKKKLEYELLEEIGDMQVLDKLLFTSRDNDVVITELMGDKNTAVFRKSIQGRSPLAVTPTRVCFATRDGRCVLIHENNKEGPYGGYEEVAMLPAHEMVMMAMCTSQDGKYLFSGGYDRVVKRWDLGKDPAGTGLTGEQYVDQVISILCAGDKNQIYVGGAHGYLARVEAA